MFASNIDRLPGLCVFSQEKQDGHGTTVLARPRFGDIPSGAARIVRGVDASTVLEEIMHHGSSALFNRPMQRCLAARPAGLGQQPRDLKTPVRDGPLKWRSTAIVRHIDLGTSGQKEPDRVNTSIVYRPE